MTASPSFRPALLAALIGSGLVLGACTGDAGPPAAQAAQAAAAAPAPQVGIHTVTAAPVTLVTELPGRTSPFLVAEVRPQVGGIIRARTFDEGSDIKSGAALYQIDDSTYRVALEAARASLARAEANLGSVRVTSSRLDQLVQRNAVSKQQRDDAAAAVKLAQADVARARADVEAARINLAYTKVSAPISGRIGRSTVTQGALVTASQAAPLAVVQQLDPIYVDVTRSSIEVLKMRSDLASGRLTTVDGSKAKVKLLLEDGTTYASAGTLEFADVTVDPGTGSVSLRAVFPNPDQILLPGMYVRAVLEEGVREGAIVVPQRGITRDARGQATALVLNGEGVVEQRQVTAERAVGNQWLISEGLAAGDRLIVEGLQRVRPGMQAGVLPAGVSPADPAKAATSGPSSGNGSGSSSGDSSSAAATPAATTATN